MTMGLRPRIPAELGAQSAQSPFLLAFSLLVVVIEVEEGLLGFGFGTRGVWSGAEGGGVFGGADGGGGGTVGDGVDWEGVCSRSKEGVGMGSWAE